MSDRNKVYVSAALYHGLALLSVVVLGGCMAGPWPFGYESHRAMHSGAAAQYWDQRIGIAVMMGPGYDDGYYGLSALNLTEEQRQRIDQIQQQGRREHAQRMEAWYQARDALQAQMNAPSPDPDAVAQAYDRVAALEREQLRACVQAYNQIRSVLTEEQREQWRDAMGGVGQ